MCGLAGILAPRSADIEARVRRMMGGLAHRGPDGSGMIGRELGSHSLVLGHTRLAIIDRSPAGAQPMVDPASGNALIYNGEIYNFAGLREELGADGARFRGHSDTEVLLSGLTRWGESCLPRLRGMFAFAFHDRKANSLLLARDPIGIKPLFVARAGEAMVFASELRPLLACGLVDASIDRDAVTSLLAYGAVQQPLTMYRNVRAVPPGSWMKFYARGDGTLEEGHRRYWQLPLPDARKAAKGAVRETLELVDEAVKSHLVSDVPVAVFLSSGVDSTIVASIAARSAPGIQMFTVGFADDLKHDESAIAARTARALDVHHTTIQLSVGEARENVLAWLAAADQPCMDGLNTFVISKAVKGAGITVALSGQGGDELFGGYPSFADVPRLVRIMKAMRTLPMPMRRAAVRLASLGRSTAFFEKLRDAVESDGTLLQVYLQRRRALSDSQMAALGFASGGRPETFLTEEMLADLRPEADDDVYNISALELRHYLGSTLLPIGDVSSMASSLELRVPLLDTRLMEAIAAVPGHVRLPNGRPDKFLLKTGFAEFLRPEISNQRKRGFSLPLGAWMSGPLRPQCEQFLATLKTSGLVDARGVGSVWNSFLKEPESPMWSRAWVLCALGSHIHFSRERA